MLTLLTLNLNYYVDTHGTWNDRKKLISEAITQIDPDIVTFQAVARDMTLESGQDQAAQLAAWLPVYQYCHFQAAVTHSNGKQEGSAILAKFPAAATDYRPLSLRPNLEDTNHRLLLRARFDLPEGPLFVFNGHFSWVYEQARDNVQEALTFLTDTNGMALLTGDLNTPPDSDALNPLRQNGWTDAWEQFHPGEEGFTFESNRLFTRIDYAWANSQLKDKLQAVEIISRQQGRHVRLSDHLGLAVTLNLKQK